MPTLFWSAPSGEENQQIEASTASQGSTRMTAVPVPQGDVLPPGTFVGQPLAWDGTSWEPVGFPGVPGELVFRVMLSAPQPFGVEAYAAFFADSTVGPPVARMQSVSITNEPFSDWSLQGEFAQLSVGTAGTFFRSFYTVEKSDQAGHLWVLEDGGAVGLGALQLRLVGGFPALGALGATPVVRQSVVGAPLQHQIDSFLDALAAFGFVTDDRDVTPNASLTGYTASAPAVLELQPAGHAPGLYSIDPSGFVRQAAATGTINVVINWQHPGFGATSFNLGTGNINVTGTLTSAPRVINSNGVAAITLTLTPAAVTGSPLVDFLAAADFIGAQP